MIAIITFLTLF